MGNFSVMANSYYYKGNLDMTVLAEKRGFNARQRSNDAYHRNPWFKTVLLVFDNPIGGQRNMAKFSIFYSGSGFFNTYWSIFEKFPENGSTLNVSFYNLKSDFGHSNRLYILVNIWEMTMQADFKICDFEIFVLCPHPTK